MMVIGDWPFSHSELTAALRRYLQDQTLVVDGVLEEPLEFRSAAGVIRGLGVDVVRAGHAEHYSYIFKQPKQATVVGTQGAGWREIGLYRSLASHIPLTIPELVTGAPDGDWLIVEPYHSAVSAEAWTADNYRQAVINLARLHERFWALDQDLSFFPWLGRPLNAELEMYLLAAARALETIVAQGAPAVVARSIERLTSLARLISHGDVVAKVLLGAPQTLAHGDYWPGNISVDEDGNQIVYDWASSSIGPGTLDLVTLVYKSKWLLGANCLQEDELIELYRREIFVRTKYEWHDREWECHWAFSLMWRFVQQWFVALASNDPTFDEARQAEFAKVWLDPVVADCDRWLGKLQ